MPVVTPVILTAARTHAPVSSGTSLVQSVGPKLHTVAVTRQCDLAIKPVLRLRIRRAIPPTLRTSSWRGA